MIVPLPFHLWYQYQSTKELNIIFDKTTWLLPGKSKITGRNEYITAVKLDCRSYIVFYCGVSIPSALVLCIGINVLHQYRWHINKNYYPFLYNNEEDFEMLQLQYHAYVFFNDESKIDVDWVMNYLQLNMEEDPDPQRLFIKSTDFRPGQSQKRASVRTCSKAAKPI